LSGVGLGGLLAALSAAAALLTLGGGDHRHPEEAAASKVSRQGLVTRVFKYSNWRDRVTRWIFLMEGLNIFISTFCVCADGFQGHSKAFDYPIQLLSF
jgi:hypothetical protein